MAKILVLGASGSGKTTSIGKTSEYKIEGLDPSETFYIGSSTKGLPFRGWNKQYTKVKLRMDKGIVQEITKEGNMYITNDSALIAQLINVINLQRQDIKKIVIDDLNYTMQDYYMKNSLSMGFDTFKKIGFLTGLIFDAIQNVGLEKDVIVMAHYEEYRSSNTDRLSYRFKTVGKMVNDYITPEGKFEIVLFATQFIDNETKDVKKVFVTNFDGDFPAKSPIGMFKETYIPNDMGYVISEIRKYENNIN